MAHRIDPKRFPNFTRAQHEGGPFSKDKAKSTKAGESVFGFSFLVGCLSLGTFGAVIFSVPPLEETPQL